MNTLLEKPTTKPKVDWFQAKMLYMQDNTVSYSDIAHSLGVSLRQVKRRGSDEDWVFCRRDVTEKTQFAIEEKTVDERVKINEKHRKQYSSVQAIIQTYLFVIANHNKQVIEQAKAEGSIPNPDKLYSPRKLLALVKTMRQAIEGERVTVDLPTIIVATTDWQPPQPTTQDEDALEAIREELAKAGIDLTSK